jgi:hypothetical protein
MPLSVQVQYSRFCPISSSFCYDSLVTWTVVCLTTAKFKPLILCYQVKVKVTLRLTASQSVSLGVEPPSGAHDQIFFFTVWHLRSCFCGAPSLTRGRVCLLYMLLAFASAVFLGSESLGTRDYILLSPTRDFPFRRLLRLAGSRWKHSTPPPHRYSMTA